MTNAGVNVPPSLVSVKLTTVSPATGPLAPTVNAVDATPKLPLEGPDNVKAVAITAGVTEFDAGDAELVPTELVAVKVNVYGVPFVSPVITCVSAVEPVLLSTPPPGLDVTT